MCNCISWFHLVKFIYETPYGLIDYLNTMSLQVASEKVIAKSAYESSGPSAPISDFCSMKQLGVFLLPLDGLLVHCRITPSIKLTGTHLYPLGRERHCESKVSCPSTQLECPRQGLEPGPLDPETSALTMRPAATAPPTHILETAFFFYVLAYR